MLLQDSESEPEYEVDTLPPQNSKAKEAEVETAVRIFVNCEKPQMC